MVRLPVTSTSSKMVAIYNGMGCGRRRRGGLRNPAVAGRMPGHMNVPLAEAGVLREDLDLEGDRRLRPGRCGLIGANDVVNPLAFSTIMRRHADLNADMAQNVIVVKRSKRHRLLGTSRERPDLQDNTACSTALPARPSAR